MSKNTNLNKAKKEKNDEFYTQLSDIEKELKHYKHHFKDKIVFCNCDDPEWSEFYNYFHLNFEELGLKKLICTHYDKEKPTYKLEIEGDINGDGKIDGSDVVKTRLLQNGDFRSEECIELLKEADIVVTNPPFSLFKEYIKQLIEYDKKFLIIGNYNFITNYDIFYPLRDNKLWIGISPRGMNFRVPESYKDKVKTYINEEGQLMSGSNSCWYTNLDHSKRHEKLILWKTYKGNEKDYPKYDNYDAIEVSKVNEIPCDYYGEMGVPITFFDKYNPDQFEIIDGSGVLAEPVIIDGKKGSGRFYINNKRLYERIVIKRKKMNKEI